MVLRRQCGGTAAQYRRRSGNQKTLPKNSAPTTCGSTVSTESKGTWGHRLWHDVGIARPEAKATSTSYLDRRQRKAPLRRRAGLMYRATTSAEQTRPAQSATGPRRHRDGLAAIHG